MEEGKGVGILVYVSLVKESRKTKGVNYFKARVSNGKKYARVVSSDP